MNDIQNESKVFGWSNCSDQIKSLIFKILEHYKRILGDNLTGFYLHGSLAMGCFNPTSSDIDFLVTVQEKLTIEQKKGIIDFLLKHYGNPPGKGIEMSIILEESLKNLIYPTPFELHYSNDWYERYLLGMVNFLKQNYDEDLAAHFVMIKNRGICIFGKPIEDIFPDIPREIYVRSLLNDARLIYERSEKDPVYTVLNLCRILAFMENGKITSKKEAGEWALAELPKHFSSLVNAALCCYSSGKSDIQTDTDKFKSFLEYTKNEIEYFGV